MLCWNCNEEIADEAKFCPHCEADMSEQPTEAEMEAAQQVFDSLSEEDQDMLTDVFSQFDTAEEAARSIMVGDCPACLSSNTNDCENDPDIQDISVGQCLDCGYIWCLECGQELSCEDPVCGHWDLCAECPDNEEFGCGQFPGDCEKVLAWREQQD
ncbi:MAG: zinc-ribbon domain-containing protein [Planctomycetota bacterium]